MVDRSSPRVCVLTAAYPSPAEPTRAAFLENYLLALRQRGFEISVVAPRVHADDPLDEERLGLRVTRFRYPSWGRRLKEVDRPALAVLGAYLASGVGRALVAANQQRSDLLYAHWILPTGVIGAIVAGITGLPLIVHAHGSDIHRYAGLSNVSREVSRTVLRCASGVLAVSQDLIATMVRHFGLEPGRARLIPMGIDENVFPAAGEVERTSGRLRLLYVGDLDVRKGIVDLASRLIEDDGLRDTVALEIVGHGAERSALEEIATRAPGTVTLRGRLEPVEVARRCRIADALVLPSLGEGAPLVVMEAIASGLPVLATPVGGIPELVEHGKNGWLERVEDFLPRIRYLRDRPGALDTLRSNLSPSSATELGARHRAREVAPLLEAVLENRPMPGKNHLVTVEP